MNKIILILISLIFLVSCSEDEATTFTVIGSVDVKLQRIDESGTVLGTFLCNYYLAGVKAELLKDGEVIETTYTMPDATCDIYYTFKNARVGVPYQVRVSLNEEMVKTSDVFTIRDEDVISFPNDEKSEDWFGALEWFTPGNYYVDLLYNDDEKMVFDPYSDLVNNAVYPNPFTVECSYSFVIDQEDHYKIVVYSLGMEEEMVPMDQIMPPGSHTMQMSGDAIKDGIHFIRTQSEANVVYTTPFIKGGKGLGGRH
jgi:hypothetical protein